MGKDWHLPPIEQEYDGRINFATDTWTSPNHYTYAAVTAHLEVKGEPIAIVLDIIELPKVSPFCRALEYFDDNCWQSHSGLNMALAFAEILEDFKIDTKVSFNN